MGPRIVVFFCLTVIGLSGLDGQADPDFELAAENGRLANEGYIRCQRYVTGWLAHADPETGLIPRNLSGSNYWNACDAAADNYPFMVLTASLTDSALFSGVMLDMLRTETELTSRIGSLPDTWDFSTGTLQQNNLSSVIFGSAEYVKDGLLPLTEWLGASPWSERMVAILDDIWANAPVQTDYGPVPATGHETAGDLLQALSRVYWMTGEQKYLDWALRLGDYFLLGGHHPTDDASTLRLRDHGNEVIAGLAELYATLSVADTARRNLYRAPLHRMLDRILEIGCNGDGFLYNEICPQTGTHSGGLADNWGYVLNAHYTVYLVDGDSAYRDAVIRALESTALPYYTDTHRFGEVMDGYADAIESALNLYNMEYTPAAEVYMDRSMRRMWDLQKEDGVIEGWHGDGNFARTSIMYCLWKSRGMTLRNWRSDVRLGAVLGWNYHSPLPLDFNYNSANDCKVVGNGSRAGALVYTDRSYSLDSIPDFLEAATLVQTACDDKQVSADDFISFTAPADLEVYAGVDRRTDSVPHWLDEWEPLPQEINTSLDDLTFRLYRKAVPEGTHPVLGGPQADGFQGYVSGGNYILFLAEDYHGETPPDRARNTLKVSLQADSSWSGKLVFDRPRHRSNMNLPFNWARINQFPEWTTVEQGAYYTVNNLTLGTEAVFTGEEMAEGIDLFLEGGKEQRLIIGRSPATYAGKEETQGIYPDLQGKQDPPAGTSFQIKQQGGMLVLWFGPLSGIHSVRIYDVRGALVFSRAVREGSSCAWATEGRSGVYIVQASSDRGVRVKKILLLP